MYEAINQSTLRQINEVITQIGPDVELFVVGGAVRDSLLGIDSKDIDFVVTKMPYENSDHALDAIYKALSTFVNKVNKVGESFGIVTATIEGEDFDFAIPRRKETKIGDGHSDFDVDLDPQASIETDLSRRDFTINAMAKRVDNGSIVDPLGGLKDLQNGVIRCVGDADSRFNEDPLRMVRAIQFASRLSTKDKKPFEIESKTLESISKNVDKVKKHISGERILAEFEKAWTKGRSNVTTFIELLNNTGLGKDLFGVDFDPKPITLNVEPEELKIARFVGLFAKGGEQEFLKIHEGLPKYYIDHLNLFRNITESEKEPWQYIGQHKNKIPLIIKIAQALRNTFGNESMQTARKIMQVPVLPKELVVDGLKLMKMGFIGKEIGQAQQKILSALWNGKIKNTKEDIENLLDTDRKG